MRQDLVQLLRDRSVGHPSRIVSATLEDRDLRIRARGWPWWSDALDVSRDQTIEFIFSGVGDGILEFPDFDSEHDGFAPFSVVPSDSLSWAQTHVSAIYCSAPLLRPLEIYLAVHDFLASQGAFRRPWHFLNFPDGEQLGPFVQITQSNSYLLGRLPPKIRDLVCAQLDAQGVPYSEVPTVLDAPGRLLVTIEMSQFFCDTAEAIFDDR